LPIPERHRSPPRPQDAFLVLNLYSNGYSALLGETVMRQAMHTVSLESGELALNDRFGKALPLSIVVRMTR
jgi:23S rRNA (cytosine1962-C5)-methyltransferase